MAWRQATQPGHILCIRHALHQTKHVRRKTLSPGFHPHGISDVFNGLPRAWLGIRNIHATQRREHGHSHGHGPAHSHGPASSAGSSNDLFETKEMVRITNIGMAVNVGLVVTKAVAGMVGHSAAMVADAGHSLSDLVSDYVTLWSVKMSRAPPDKEHPYGHGKYESIGALSVSAFLIMAGVGIGDHSINVLMPLINSTAEAQIPTALALGAAVLSLVSKEALFHATMRVGEKTKSDVVVANAWHHRSDALSSLVALVGIGGAMAGLPWLDAAAGLVVSGMIIKTGYEVGRDSFHSLTDSGDPKVIALIRELVLKVPGVIGINRCRARKMGPFTQAEIRIYVDGRQSVSAAAHIADRVKQKIRSTHPDIIDLSVNIRPTFAPPASQAHLLYSHKPAGGVMASGESCSPPWIVEKSVREIVEKQPGIGGVTHIVTHYLRGQPMVEVQVVVDPIYTIREAHDFAKNAREVVLKECPDLLDSDFHLELGDFNKAALPGHMPSPQQPQQHVGTSQ